jgi:aspartate/methionine/tyrosine aminotransferase
MTGWRLGYVVGPPALISTLERLSLAFGRSSAAFVQRAGIAALRGPQECVVEMRQVFTERRAVVDHMLNQIPSLSWITPEGAFYTFIDFSEHGDDSIALSRRLLGDARVFLTPGTFYGPGGNGWLRMSWAGPIQRAIEALDAIHETVARW